MLPLCVTRFTDETNKQRSQWKTDNKFIGTIYGTPVKINNTIVPEDTIIVLEMNNTTNKIEGIGVIKNKLYNKKCKIYNDNNYNRYIYKSNYIFNIDQLDRNEIELLIKIENILFYGRSNYKRGQGIQRLPKTAQLIDGNKTEHLLNLMIKKYLNLNI
tara:strand:+ start:3520 stop:3993 length:474 start_codon:yes stop_codon:yes gene_type:complete